MRLRLGFISNSSSSNFVISRNKNLSEKTQIILEIDLACEAEQIIRTNQDVKDYILERCAEYDENELEKIFLEDEYLKQLYDRMIESINSGNIIYVMEVEYHEPEHQAMIENRLDNCVVLNSEDF